MSRAIPLVFFGILSAGCVPVTNPVGDIDKAEPDKDLIGSWRDDEREPRLWVVDHPRVKGNPKGLMRVRVVENGKKLEDLKPDDAFWFFTATIGKETYSNLLVVSANPKKHEWHPDFGREGEYARWAKHEQRGYWVARLSIRGQAATIDDGDHRAFDSLMKEHKFMEVGEYYVTPRDWLATYLEKNGPAAIFNSGKGIRTLTRVDEKK
jgi:hypothetical protein